MQQRRAILIRIDRIGDLVLTLPVQKALQSHGYLCEWFIAAQLGFVPDVAKEPFDYLEVERRFSFLQFFALFRRLHAFRPDLAIVFHAPWWMSLLLWIARVPCRAGQLSQWHSFLFFNQGLRQRRSQGDRSELEYNFLLAEHATNLPLERGHLTLHVNGRTALVTHGLAPQGYYVVHAGMGGSALNWPSEYYANLIQRLSEGSKVVLTGTVIDRPYLGQLRALLSPTANIIWLNEKLSSHELMQVLAHAKAVVAPSTGVVHLAASLGVRTVGLYSPVQVQAARRWGPVGPRALALSPEPIACPGISMCVGPGCDHFNCMTRVSVDTVVNSL